MKERVGHEKKSRDQSSARRRRHRFYPPSHEEHWPMTAAHSRWLDADVRAAVFFKGIGWGRRRFLSPLYHSATVRNFLFYFSYLYLFFPHSWLKTTRPFVRRCWGQKILFVIINTKPKCEKSRILFNSCIGTLYKWTTTSYNNKMRRWGKDFFSADERARSFQAHLPEPNSQINNPFDGMKREENKSEMRTQAQILLLQNGIA